MLNVKFPDFFFNAECVISESTNNTDDEGNEILHEKYNGLCSYQVGSGGSSGLQGNLYQVSPDIYLPVPDVEINVNDNVRVKCNQLIVNATVESYNPVPEFNSMAIYLKHGTNRQ